MDVYKLSVYKSARSLVAEIQSIKFLVVFCATFRVYLFLHRYLNVTKMRLIVYFNFISFYVYLTKAFDDSHMYIILIKQIRSYYSASSIVFLYPTKLTHLDDMKISYVVHTWSSMFEHEQISTIAMPIKDTYLLERYYKNVSRPLIVSILKGSSAFREFSHVTKFMNMSRFVWFVIFVSSMLDQKFHDCHTPQGNPFHLSFNTEMLVKCWNDSVLREWYSLDGETTEMYDLFKRSEVTKESPVSVYEPITNLSLHERRNDLKGKVLRGVIVKNSLLITYENNEFQGYFTEAIKGLENALNFTLDIVTEELEYGSYNTTTKRWTGAMRHIASKVLDIGIGDFKMTDVRLNYVDYLIPITLTRSCIFMKQPEIFAVKWLSILASGCLHFGVP